MDRRKTTKKKKETVSPEVQARREAYDWIQSLISALLICVLVFVFVVRIMDVNGSSMVPTLVNGDKVLVSGLFYEPDRGDIVVFKKDSYNDNKALVKRVIAVEGDVVNIDFDNGIVYVNGEAVEEDYIDVSTNTKLDFIGPQTVPENCLFVMGDNRNASQGAARYLSFLQLRNGGMMAENAFEKLNIQWFPGHMTKAQRMIEENIGLVDAVCELLDARIPRASRNPDIDRLAAGKPRLVILNRCDLADPAVTKLWSAAFRDQGLAVLETDARSGKGINGFVPAVRALLADKLADYERKGQSGRGLKIMVLGIPNVGKSTFINKVAGRKAAAAGDKPGVTRGRQWINIDRGLDMLDTPGILWPKFDSQEVGEMLAVTNAIKSDVLDRETLAANFMLRLCELYPEAIESRYGIKPTGDENGFELLELAAKRRGFLVSRGEYDIERMANTLLDEYHSGKLGRLSLERPE